MMVLPADPVTNFVVGHAGFAFAAFEALFNPMGRFGHAHEFQQRGAFGRVAQVVVALHDSTVAI